MRTNGKRILIVEDDQTLALALREAFAAEGAVVLGPAPTVFYATHLLGRRGIDCAVVSADLHAGDSEAFTLELMSAGTPVITLSSVPNLTASLPNALRRPICASDVVDSVAELLNSGGAQTQAQAVPLTPIETNIAFGVETTPHMRLVKVHTGSMRRQNSEQKQTSL